VVTYAGLRPPAFPPLDSQGSGALSHWDGEISGACMAVNAISQVSQRCQLRGLGRGQSLIARRLVSW